MRLTFRLCSRVAALAAAFAATPAFSADQALIDAAKKEGSVTWYTTQIINQFVLPAAQAFQKKYGITVNYIRADSAEVVVRVANEGHAGKVQADVVDGTLTTPALEKQGLVMKYVPDSAQALPKQYVDPNGYWVATNLYVLTPAFNTDLVPKGTEPKTYQDLLDPKWKGKIAWSSSAGSSSGAPGFVGNVLKEMGEDKGMDYLRALAKQQVTGIPVSARQVLDQVIAGEYAVALQTFNNHSVISAAQGAPSQWIPMNPAMGVLSVISVTEGAPHSNAGKLLVDFLASSDGQKLFRDADYIPVDPAVPPKIADLRPDGETFRANYFTPETVESSIPQWAKIASDLFR
jgi:ABC-type Fe3+ transport system substrate-binding protein